MQIVTLDKEVLSLHQTLDDEIIGEKSAGFVKRRKKLDSLFDELSSRKGSDSKELLEKTYRSFLRNALLEQAAIEHRNTSQAKTLDMTGTGPSEARLEVAIESLLKQSGKAALFAVIYTTTVSMTALAGAAIFIALITGLSQKKKHQADALILKNQSIEASERRFKSLIRNSTDLIAVSSSDGKLTLVSDVCERSWGITSNAAVGLSIFGFMAAGDQGRLITTCGNLRTGTSAVGTIELQMPNGAGGLRDYETRIIDLTQDVDVAGILWTFHDLTDRKKIERKLSHNALHDGLTNLPNRSLFLDRLAQRIKDQGKPHDGFAVIYIDLDNFKVVNDSLGHAAGDLLLVEMASRLASVLRVSDTVARLGGDEFTILLKEAHAPEVAIEIAERILSVLSAPILLEVGRCSSRQASELP